MKIVLAHTELALGRRELSMALHKDTCTSTCPAGAEYFQPQIIQYANGPLKRR